MWYLRVECGIVGLSLFFSFCLRIVFMYLNISGTFCGVFRRQALDRGAMILKCNKIVTGDFSFNTQNVVLKYFLQFMIVYNNLCPKKPN